VENYPGFILAEDTVETIQAVIGKCSAFEYYVVSQYLDWLVRENRSAVVYAVGEAVTDRLMRQVAHVE
jgi:hypothetical protein